MYLCMHVRVCGVLKMTDEGSNEMKEAQRTSVDGKKLLFNTHTHARTQCPNKSVCSPVSAGRQSQRTLEYKSCLKCFNISDSV